MSAIKQNYKYKSFYHMLGNDLKDIRPLCIAFLGGGGKSSLISRMGKEYSNKYARVALTSLTKSGIHHTETLCFPQKPDGDELSAHFALANPLKILRRSGYPEKLNGVTVDELNVITSHSDVCLFECDGARKRPLKIHSEYDPMVPDFTDSVIILVGADAVHTTPAEGKVHRTDRFCRYWGISPTTLLTPDFIASVVTSQKGYGKKIPFGIKKVYFVNKADTFERNAILLAKSIWKEARCPTFFGSVRHGFWHEV